METHRWLKSSACESNACVEVMWRKSSLCDSNGGNCVEVGRRKVDRPRDEEETRDGQRSLA